MALRFRHLVAAVGVLAGCATAPDPNAARVVVERTANRTTWSTPEALAADARPAPAPPRTEGRKVVAVNAPAPPPARPAPPPPDAPLPPSGRLVYFDFDRADIKDEFQPLLQAHAKALQAAPAGHAVVEGHADERGSAEYNLALGQRRAEAVLQALLQYGAGASQLEAVSYGDTRPAVEGHDERAWSKNRRAEIVER